MTEKLTRIAIVNSDKCKPTKCQQECKKSCPVVKMGKLCIEIKSIEASGASGASGASSFNKCTGSNKIANIS